MERFIVSLLYRHEFPRARVVMKGGFEGEELESLLLCTSWRILCDTKGWSPMWTKKQIVRFVGAAFLRGRRGSVAAKGSDIAGGC